MDNKWLKNDWSLAYFIYYVCWLGYWGIVLTVVVQTVTVSAMVNDGTQYIHDVPVQLQLEQFSDFRDFKLDKANINIPEKTTARIGIEVTESNIFAFLYYNGLKLYRAAILFIILFVLAKMMKNVAENNPFDSNNPFYLYIIGWTLITSSVINIGISFLPLPILTHLALPEGFKVTSLDMFGNNFLILGIFVIVLGYVFKEGARIHEEQKLTV